MSAKHAKAPWSAGNENGYQPSIIFDADGEGVASVYGVSLHSSVDKLGDSDAAGMANARLIAAAPELLEALKLAHLFAELWADEFDSSDARKARDAAEAALSKAGVQR